MNSANGTTGDVISPHAYAFMLASRWLRARLFPESVFRSPYDVIDYDSTLVIHDGRGMRATLARSQTIRFSQQGVSAILDHVWGDGVALTTYDNEAGVLADSIRDGTRRHLVIRLKRPMERGEELRFRVRRDVIAAFGDDTNWLETTIDHPIRQLRTRVVFPQDRPAREVTLTAPSGTVRMPIGKRPDGRAEVIFHTRLAQAHTPYITRWRW